MYFMNSRIDHIVIGATNLISGTKILETKLSTKFSPGGEHMIMGTHNKLLKLQSNNSLRIACDGEGASGKSAAAKLISHKYKPMFYMNSGLLFRYASRLIIKHKPKKIIPYLREKFINLNYKHITRLDLHSQEISNHVVLLAKQKKVREIIRIFQKKIIRKHPNINKIKGILFPDKPIAIA